MEIVFGVGIVLVSLVGWGGQAISLVAPSTAERWKLTETESSVDPAIYGDIRGEALWDTLTLWTMPLAGALLIAGLDAWAPLGLVAGGTYIYFGGRGVLTRTAIVKRGGRVGEPENLKTAYVALTVWALLGLSVTAGAAAALAWS